MRFNYASLVTRCVYANQFDLVGSIRLHYATHIHGNVLDLVLTTNTDRLQNLSITNSFKSDHHIIQFNILSNSSLRYTNTSGSVYNYAKGDYSGMDFYLMEMHFDTTSFNAEHLWTGLKSAILDGCSLFVPKLKRSSYHHPKWFTPEIKHLLNCIRSLRRNIRKSYTEIRANKLSTLEVKLQALMSTAKETYGARLTAAFTRNPKDLYRHLRHLSHYTTMPQVLIYDSTPIYHPKEKVEAFNKFFNSTFTISDFVLPPQHRMPTPSNQLSQITVSESDVFEALVCLNPNKAQGCDKINPHILKYCCTSLTSPVTHLFSTCMNQSILPQEWKVHKICPVPKKGDLSKITNYRPISLLCVLSKVLESIIYAKIIPFIYPQLNKSQFGFLQNRSCLTQLLSSFSQIYDSIENKNQCDVIYLDFRKAFDSVPHNELLFKLWRFGITGPLWLWFKHYLISRSHFVSMDSVSSDVLPVLSGVPQGSVLGPLLFLIYVNDIPDSVSHSSALLFADDTKLVKSIQTFNDSLDLQKDIDSMVDWCREWKLSLNENKCAAIRYSLLSKCNTQPTYTIKGTLVETTSTHRDLGIIVDQNLSWAKHYNHISLKAYRSLHFIRRTIPHAPVYLKKQLYITLVRSHLTYCSQLWRPRLLKDIRSLEQIQRRATKFILQDFSSDYKTRLIKLNMLPLMHWLELQDVMFLVKCFKDPSENFNPLTFVSFITHSTRSATNHKLTVNFKRTSTTRHFYFNRVVRLWNYLPTLDLSLSYSTLKYKLKQIFWAHFTDHFNSSNICTFHILCPCLNCVNCNHSAVSCN